MSNDPFTPIRLRLLAVLDNRPYAIVPILAEGVVALSARIRPEMSEDRIDSVAGDLQNLTNMAEEYGRIDIANELDAVEDLLRADFSDFSEFSQPVESNGSRVGEIYIDFAGGTGSITCDGCNAADVAEALITVAENLRMMDETPDYIGFDEGKISVGQAGRDDPVESVESNECRLGINFLNGNISGGCSGCNATDVAEALGEIVTELQRRNITPAYIAFTGDGVEVETNL
jgi:hypothetical protein